MNHKQKKTLARRHFTYEDKMNGKTIFTSKFWINRKKSIANRVKKPL